MSALRLLSACDLFGSGKLKPAPEGGTMRQSAFPMAKVVPFPSLTDADLVIDGSETHLKPSLDEAILSILMATQTP